MSDIELRDEIQSFGLGYAGGLTVQLAAILPFLLLGLRESSLLPIAATAAVIAVLSVIPGFVALLAHRLSELAKVGLGAATGLGILALSMVIPNVARVLGAP